MPVGQLENRSTFGGLIKGVQARFMDVADQVLMDYKPSYERLVTMKSTDKSIERTSGVAGPGDLVLKTEGDNFTRASRLKTYDTEFVPVAYGKMIEATIEEIEDNDWSSKLDAARHLTARGLTTKDRHFFQIFNDAFVTTNSQANYPISRYGDAKPLASTVHPRKDGGTAQSNASATSVALSETSLDVARQALMNQLEDDGTIMDTTGPLLLVVPLALEKLASEITKSTKKSGTANNDVNFYEGVGINTLAVKYLGAAQGGSDTAWFLVMPETAKLIMMNRKPLTPRTDVDPDTLNVKYSVYGRWCVGFSDWRGFWGSKGTGAAYSG